MNNLVMAIGARVGYAIGNALSAVGGIASSGGRSLTLVPTFLHNLLWIISQKFLDLATSAYGQNAAVYACLRLLSQSVPEPPLVAHFVDVNGKTGDPIPWRHPLSRLIREPNELMTEYEMWELTVLHLGITGISTWFKERNNRGEIIALWPLRPDRIGPIYSVEAVEGQKVIKGWSYQIPGTSEYLPIARQDVWFVNLANPAGDSGGLVEGLGPLQVLSMEVGADNEATRFVGAMLANYAAPGVILTTKNAIRNKEEASIIKAGFMREFGGSRRGVPGVVDAETTVTQIGFNLQQLEFPAVRSISESRIAAAFGVPAILAGLNVGLEAGIRATISEQREYFAETTLANYWVRLSTSFTRDVAREFDERIACEFDLRKVKALQAQFRQETERVSSAYAQAAVTVDEYREKVLNLPPFGGDLGASVLVPNSGTLTLTTGYKQPERVDSVPSLPPAEDIIDMTAEIPPEAPPNGKATSPFVGGPSRPARWGNVYNRMPLMPLTAVKLSSPDE
jgi:HK97 family phage portal protein